MPGRRVRRLKIRATPRSRGIGCEFFERDCRQVLCWTSFTVPRVERQIWCFMFPRLCIVVVASIALAAFLTWMVTTGVLEYFRVHFGGRPLLISIGILAVLLVGRKVAGPAVTRRWVCRADVAIAWTSAIALVAYAGVAFWYAGDPHFFDNAEPTIPAVGWLFHLGRPIYPTLDAAERYAHIYGPFAYMFQGYVLALFGPSIAVSKSASALVGISSLAVSYLALRKVCSPVRSAALTGIVALILLLFRNYSFWTRPDPLQLFAVSAALLFAASGPGNISAVLVGVASGILWNLKFTGPLYSVPVLALVHRKGGRRAIILSVGTAILIAVLPFEMFPNVSFPDYVKWVRLSARTGLLLSLLRQNIEWAIYFLMPILLSFCAVPRTADVEWRDMIITLGVGMCGVVVAAAKPGAGPYHLIPFLPVIAYLVGRRLSHSPASNMSDGTVPLAVLAFLLATAAIAIAQQAQLIATMAARSALREPDDIRNFADTHPGVIEMGYGRTEALSFERPILVFRTGSYLLDQPAIREHQLAGIELPQATINAVAQCRAKYWLIPKGEPPFSGLNSYNAVLVRPLYSDSFRQAFEAAYMRMNSTRYYDVWQCRAEAAR